MLLAFAEARYHPICADPVRLRARDPLLLIILFLIVRPGGLISERRRRRA